MQRHELGGFLMFFAFAEGPQRTSNNYGFRFKSAWRTHPPKIKNHNNFDSLAFQTPEACTDLKVMIKMQNYGLAHLVHKTYPTT
jgi:hypothetical protein